MLLNTSHVEICLTLCIWFELDCIDSLYLPIFTLFYEWTVILCNKKDISQCSVFHNLILKFSAFDQFSEQMKNNIHSVASAEFQNQLTRY